MSFLGTLAGFGVNRIPNGTRSDLSITANGLLEQYKALRNLNGRRR